MYFNTFLLHIGACNSISWFWVHREACLVNSDVLTWGDVHGKPLNDCLNQRLCPHVANKPSSCCVASSNLPLSRNEASLAVSSAVFWGCDAPAAWTFRPTVTPQLERDCRKIRWLTERLPLSCSSTNMRNNEQFSSKTCTMGIKIRKKCSSSPSKREYESGGACVTHSDEPLTPPLF